MLRANCTGRPYVLSLFHHSRFGLHDSLPIFVTAHTWAGKYYANHLEGHKWEGVGGQLSPMKNLGQIWRGRHHEPLSQIHAIEQMVEYRYTEAMFDQLQVETLCCQSDNVEDFATQILICVEWSALVQIGLHAMHSHLWCKKQGQISGSRVAWIV